MATVVIPLLNSLPDQTFNCVLDGRDYIFRFKNNPRGELVSMDLLLADETPLALGQKLAGDAPLLRLFDSPLLPPGRMWVTDMSGAGRDPDRNTLGNDILLLYEEAANG